MLDFSTLFCRYLEEGYSEHTAARLATERCCYEDDDDDDWN